MPLPLARARVRKIKSRLEPLVERIMVVGSIRRQQEEVGDLELLAEPKVREEPDLFHPRSVPDLEPVVNRLGELGTIVKSGPRYVQVKLGFLQSIADAAAFGDSCQLDLFLCHPPASWGALQVIRTGPSDFSRICVTRLRKKGWRCHRGAVWAPHEELPPPNRLEADHNTETEIDGRGYTRLRTPTEDDFFEACDMDGVPPHLRDEVVARLQHS
jgi:DNA polymerase/3'-5' exonuclease PolX